MQYGSTSNLLILILHLFLFIQSGWTEDGSCVFPESEIEPFFFDLLSNTPEDSIVVDTVVEPPNAKIQIANIRSNNIPNINFADYFEIETRSRNGQFLLVTKKPLLLPNFPSSISETLLYTTVNCNGNFFPLITIRVRGANNHPPKFYNEPYEITILKNSLIGSQYLTSILAVDADPSERYVLKYSVQTNKEQFSLVTEPQRSYDVLESLPEEEYSRDKNQWALEQLPHSVYLKVLSHLTRPVYYLNISDNGFPKAKEAFAQLKVVVRSVNEIQARFSQPEYFANFTRDLEVNIDLIPNQQIYATFPTPSSGNSNGPIVYELLPTKYSDLITVDPLTARIRLARPIIETDLPPNIPLRLRAFPQNNPQNFVEAALTLNDMTEVKLTYFVQCHYEAHLLENPSTYTKVLQFNYKGDVDQVELLNGTEYFEVDSDGTMLVKYGVDIDRETMDRITVKARLKSHLPFHPKSLELCQIATANIFIDDLNDHTPKFEKPSYTFYIDLLPYNNTEVGMLRAVDDDMGEFGQVKYRILIDEHESLPFILFQADGAATIYYVTRENFYPERSYTFAVEAYDADSDPRTSRVSVHVVLESEAEMRQRQRDEEAMRREEEIKATSEDQQHWATTVSDSQDAAVNSFTIDEGEERIASADSDEGSPFAVEHSGKATRGYHRAKYENREKAERRRVHHARQLQVEPDSSTEPVLEKYLPSQEKMVNRQPNEIEQFFVATTAVLQGTNSETTSQRPNAVVPSKIFLKQLDLAAAAAKSSRVVGRLGQKVTAGFVDTTYSTTAIPSSSLAKSDDIDTDLIMSTTTAFSSPSLANLDSSNSKLRFSQQNYTFWLKGRLDIGDYIGMVHLSPLLYRVSGQSSDDGSSAEAVSDLSANKALLRNVEFSVEEGILGFVDIDRFTGKLSVGRKLVEDSYEEIRFSVAALDNDNKILATTLVTVLMDDVASIYDAKPVFEQAFYAFDFDENQVVERFGKVEAHHKAVDTNKDRLWYVLDRKLPDTAHFRIDPETGWLSNRAALDAEQRHRYNIKVSACLESNTTSCGFTEVAILVRDVNDNAPEFNRSLFDVTIPLNLPADTELIRLIAVDADTGKNADIEYSLRAPGSFQELFEVNSKSGVVSLAKRLGTTMENVAEGLQYRIDIDAIDHGSPPMSSSASLIFRTANVNPSSPVFDKFRYEVTVDSPIPHDVEIIRVHAVDPDPGFDGKVQYQFSDLDELANANIAKQFAIDPQGLITTRTRVDPPVSSAISPLEESENGTDCYQQSHDYTIQLVVEAIDQSRVFPRRSQTVVVIQLKPSKTSATPTEIEFIPLPKTVFISTAKPAGTNILKVLARAKDGGMLAADDRVDYSLVDQGAQFFQIRDGQLVVGRRLEAGEYELTICATRSAARGVDDASGSTFIEHHLRVVVMKNRDKYPVFERLNYDVQIDSDAQFPLKIPSLNATLLNGQLVYSIPAVVTDNYTDNSNGGIVIDQITGDITIFEECVKELATKSVHKIEHFLLVRATNAHFSKFFSDATIRLVIVNRNNPEFLFDSQLYRYIVPENYPVGSIVGDSSLAFRIRQTTVRGKGPSREDDTHFFFQPPSDVFGVLANGSIILMKHLDLEKLADIVDPSGVLDLNVVAERGEDKANAKVQIALVDENEFAPHFERPKYLFVLAAADTSEVIGRVAATDEDFSDRDNLKYRAVFGNASEFVEVLEHNGMIVRKASLHDLKSGAMYELLIEVTDAANHTDRTAVQFIVDVSTAPADRLHFIDEPSGIITMDLNQLERFVRKSAAEMPIYRMMAIANASVDNAAIRYTIGDDEPRRSLFRIDSASGQLFYLLNADHIAANSQRPQELELLVEASLPDGEAVRKVYTIRFGVDEKRRGDDDDVETSSLTEASTISSTTVEFRLTSTAEEGALMALNFTSKRFKFVIRNPKRDQMVGQLTLLPPRPSHFPPLQMFIEPPPFRNWFLLDPRTSLLFIRQVPANLTGRQRAEFHVVAYEPNRPQQRAECNVTVDLVLPGTALPTVIPMPIREGEAMGPASTNNEFTANDDILSNDEDAQMESIQFGEGQKSASTTHQQTILPLSSSSSSRFTISTDPDETPELLATTAAGMEADGDETVERMSTTALPLASRRADEEESDDKFRFPYELYTAVLPEGMYGNRGATATLHPQSLRQDMPTGTTYFMDASADPSLPFHIRNDTGELIAFANIDREKVSRYEFLVRAIHPSDERQRASTRIQIDILDVNDNYPIFVDAASAIAINALTLPGTVLTTLIAVDVDEGDAGRVSYRLEENPHELFDVAPKTGELILVNALPVELSDDVFHVTVTAMDGGRPALKTSHRMRIEVFADSIERPIFKHPEYNADVLLAESTAVGAKTAGQNGTFIAHVLAGTGRLHYEINDPSSDLFRVDDNGIVRLGRTPMESELNRRYTLNVTARRINENDDSVSNKDEDLASTLVNVYLEKPLPTTVVALSSTTISPSADSWNTDELPPNNEQCGFDRKTYFAEIRENTAGKHRLTTLKTRNCDGVKLHFSLNDTRNENFEVDEITGDFYVLRELDRERKSMHFVSVNVSIVNTSRLVRREATVTSLNPIVEYMKNRLAENQALVSVKVLDENDNPPTFARLNSQGVYVFVVDWQAPVLQPIARVEAIDLDERSKLIYSLKHSSSDDFFEINATSGVIALQRPLVGINQFHMEVAASDGLHEVRAPLQIHKLELGVNVVILTSERPADQVEERNVERQLSKALELSAHILVKQIFTGEDGRPDRQRTHLVMYALDRLTRVPVDAATLKTLLDEKLPNWRNSSSSPSELEHLTGVTLPIVSRTFAFTWANAILYAVSFALLLTVCSLVFLLLRCCKRHQALAKSDMEYMVNSEYAGPRPYNVELITRKMAQNILAARPLPDPHEEVTMSSKMESSDGYSTNNITVIHEQEPQRVSHQNSGLDNSSEQQTRAKLRSIPSITIGSTMA